jgi:magnesium transporter
MSKGDVVKTIINRYKYQNPETRFYLEDIQDHVVTMLQHLNNYELSLGRSHSNYLAQLSINIAKEQSNSNDIVMRMTMLASILVPLNIVTGLWGMNVRVPGEDGSNLSWFFSILTLMIALAFATYWFVIKYTLR